METEAAVKKEVATEGAEGVEVERVAVTTVATAKGEVLVAEESPAKEGGTAGGAAEERAVAVESAGGADIPFLRNFSGPQTPFWTRLDLRAAQKYLDLILIKPGLGSWPAQMAKGQKAAC